MKRFLPIVLLLTVAIRWTDAKIGDTPAAYDARYGHSIKKAFDSDGSGLSVYKTEKFKEIRVTFVKGTSRKEVYKYAGDSPIPQPLVDTIHAENSGQDVFDGSNEISVRPSKTDLSEHNELERPSGRETTYTGAVKERNDGEARYAVLTDHGTVVELAMMPPRYPQEFNLTPGRRYSVTLLEQWADDTNTRVGVVSKREHVDWFDCVDDAGLNGIQQLVRITEGDKVVFDRSICGLHHVKMEIRSVEIGYGMYAPQSKAEIYCMEHFPHFRDFALGGCVVGDAKFSSIYICPKCVAECNEYTRQHATEEKHR